MLVVIAVCVAALQFFPRHQTVDQGNASLSRTLTQSIIATGLQHYDTTLPYRYTITQAEFQTDNRGTSYVLQISDPLSPSQGNTTSGLPGTDLMIYGPLRLLKAGVGPQYSQLSYVNSYIISIADPQQTVYEISAAQMGQYVSSSISDQQLAQEMKISTLVAPPMAG